MGMLKLNVKKAGAFFSLLYGLETGRLVSLEARRSLDYARGEL